MLKSTSATTKHALDQHATDRTSRRRRSIRHASEKDAQAHTDCRDMCRSSIAVSGSEANHLPCMDANLILQLDTIFL